MHSNWMEIRDDGAVKEETDTDGIKAAVVATSQRLQ